MVKISNMLPETESAVILFDPFSQKTTAAERERECVHVCACVCVCVCVRMCLCFLDGEENRVFASRAPANLHRRLCK